ncbi:MAG: hypothetical protein ACI936_002727 [Paraglaciecola sp.]|jgi:hypothetical protein
MGGKTIQTKERYIPTYISQISSVAIQRVKRHELQGPNYKYFGTIDKREATESEQRYLTSINMGYLPLSQAVDGMSVVQFDMLHKYAQGKEPKPKKRRPN